VPDDVARVLKQAPELDNSIAMNRKALSLSPAANLYPRAGGMASFCAAAEAYCERNGIKILTGAEIASMRADGDSVALERNGETIRFDAAVWTSGARPLGKVLLGEDAMEGLEHPVPMTLYYFRVRLEDCGPYTYVQNHDAALDVFRCSTQGRYGNQVTADGETYVCAESTTMTGEPRWEDPEGHAGQIWDQCVQMGAVSGAPLDCAAFKAPVTYRAPLIGYRDAERRVMDAAAALPALAVMDTRAFTRSAIFATMSNLSL
jgi:protoporphyrinogen oxidase